MIQSSGLLYIRRIVKLSLQLTLEYFIISKRNSIAVNIYNSKSPRQPLIHFLFLQICLFWTFYTYVLIQYVDFVSGFFYLI